MDLKTKHLEFIQTTINRMANNSFLLKGWAITLVGALFALSFKEVDRRYLSISVVVVTLFWVLDSYYLSRERGFVCLYDQVRKKEESEIDFAMSARQFTSTATWISSAFSSTLLIFYGGLLVVHVIIGSLL